MPASNASYDIHSTILDVAMSGIINLCFYTVSMHIIVYIYSYLYKVHIKSKQAIAIMFVFAFGGLFPLIIPTAATVHFLRT